MCAESACVVLSSIFEQPDLNLLNSDDVCENSSHSANETKLMSFRALHTAHHHHSACKPLTASGSTRSNIGQLAGVLHAQRASCSANSAAMPATSRIRECTSADIDAIRFMCKDVYGGKLSC